MAFEDQLFAFFDTIWFIIKWFWWAGILLYIGILKLLWKNWPLEAVIVEKRDNNLIKTNDRIGKFYDKYTGMTGYRLQKNKDTIPVPNFDWVMHNVYKPTNLFERFVNLIRGNAGTVFLFKYGTKQYKPIHIREKGRVTTRYQAIKGEDGKEKIINIYVPLDLRDKLGVLDFKVVDWDNINFMVQEQRAVIERTKKKKDFWMAVAVPLILIGVSAIVCIVMFKFSYDYSISMRGNAQPQQNTEAEPPKIPVISDLIPGS